MTRLSPPASVKLILPADSAYVEPVLVGQIFTTEERIQVFDRGPSKRFPREAHDMDVAAELDGWKVGEDGKARRWLRPDDATPLIEAFNPRIRFESTDALPKGHALLVSRRPDGSVNTNPATAALIVGLDTEEPKDGGEEFRRIGHDKLRSALVKAKR